jgi:hypothetical protein
VTRAIGGQYHTVTGALYFCDYECHRVLRLTHV